MSESPRILLIDEHRPRRRRLAAVLACAGYRVIESPGPAAAAVQKKLLPDALVLNVTDEFERPGFLRRFPDGRGQAPAARRRPTPL